MTPILRTARLVLHPLGSAHAAVYSRLYRDPAVMGLIGAPLSAAQAPLAFERVLEQTALPSPPAWYWIARDDAGDCGLLALLRDRDLSDVAETGILLLPGAGGRGYAREALAALVTHAFRGLGMQCIRTRHHPDNLAVVGLMEALGFRSCTTTAIERRWSLRDEDWQFQLSRHAGFAKPRARG
jgi:RimJ/RimL family protein N-acetyltransferase